MLIHRFKKKSFMDSNLSVEMNKHVAIETSHRCFFLSSVIILFCPCAIQDLNLT